MNVDRPTDRSDAQLLRALGHVPEGIDITDRRAEFPGSLVKCFFVCSCGFRSTAQGSVRNAAEAGVFHMRKVAREYRSTGGVSLRNTGTA